MLQESNPRLAAKMEAFSSNSDLPGQNESEIENWLHDLQLEGCDVLYIYGLTGFLYEALLPWLKEDFNRQAVFLEDDPNSLHIFLCTAQATSFLQDPQVEVVDLFDEDNFSSAIRLLTEEHILRSFAVIALPSYALDRLASFSMIKDLIEFESAEQNIRNQELAQFGVIFFNNFYRNLFQLSDSYHGDEMAGKFKDIPAIICGAGPSLEEAIPLLKTLENKALLVAPGSSLNILTMYGVWPHFGVNIDPTAETFHRQIMNRGFETPIFYRNRIYYEALTAIHGPRLFLSGAVFYKISEWFDKKLGFTSLPFQGGYNVVHAAMEIARFLGCNPIILTGLDLCFEEGKHYSSGVERHPLFPEITEKKGHLGSPITVKNQKGDKVQSYWPWIAEAQWADLYARRHPDIKILNASQGIPLFSIPGMPLEDAIRLHCNNSYAIEEIVHQTVQKTGKIGCSHEQIEELLKMFYQSLKTCESLLQMGKLMENELRNEIGFSYLLEQFDAFFLKFIAKDLRNAERIFDPEQRKARYAQLQKERSQFVLQTARINLKIIEIVFEEQKNRFFLEKQAPFMPDIKAPSIKSYFASSPLYSEKENDRKEGAHFYYYEDGTPKSELYYQNGLLHGRIRLYYPTGQCKRELFFFEGQRQGKERSWYENGQLFTEVEYDRNEARLAHCWFADGRLAK